MKPASTMSAADIATKVTASACRTPRGLAGSRCDDFTTEPEFPCALQSGGLRLIADHCYDVDRQATCQRFAAMARMLVPRPEIRIAIGRGALEPELMPR